MLLTKEQIKWAMNLSTEEVRQAVNAGGYGSHDVLDSTFLGVNPTGQFVYEITFPYPEDEGTASGNLYLKFEREAFSKKFILKGDF